MEGTSLRERQRRALLAMLAETENGDAGAWKLLVLDGLAQRVLAPLLTVNELREAGVTLHLPLVASAKDSPRERVPETPGVYFIDGADDAAVSAVCADIRARIYDTFYLSSVGTWPRAAVERLAAAEAAAGAPGPLVRELSDRCADYVCLEDDVFVLSARPPAGKATFYEVLADRTTSEDAITRAVECSASGVFSALLSLASSSTGAHTPVPNAVVVGARGGAAEAVGARLEARLRDHAANAAKSGAAQNTGDTQRTLVVLLDRSTDLASVLQHSPCYNALVHDVLGMSMNRICVTGDGREPLVFDIDARDAFWRANASQPFPAVADNVDAAVRAVVSDEERVRRGGGSTGGVPNSSMGNAMTAEELRVAISVLPELAERKRVVSGHRALCVAILEAIKRRSLPDIIHAQQQFSALDARRIREIVAHPGASSDGKPSPNDRLRLYACALLLRGEALITPADAKACEDALRAAGCDMAAIAHVRRAARMRSMASDASAGPAAQSPPDKSVDGNDFLQRITGAGGTLGAMMVSSVRGLLPDVAATLTGSGVARGPDALPLLRTLDTLFDALSSQRVEAFSGDSASSPVQSAPKTADGTPKAFFYADPRAPRHAAHTLPAATTARTAYGPHVVVFVVGGSAYSEANRVAEYVRTQRRLLSPAGGPPSVVFGTTDLVPPEAFLAALARVGG